MCSSLPAVSIDQTVSGWFPCVYLEKDWTDSRLDFDGVTFHISTPESKTKIIVSIQLRCYNELLKYGAQQVLEREYGSLVVAPENGYNFSIQVDLENLPADKGAHTIRQE